MSRSVFRKDLHEASSVTFGQKTIPAEGPAGAKAQWRTTLGVSVETQEISVAGDRGKREDRKWLDR